MSEGGQFSLLQMLTAMGLFGVGSALMRLVAILNGNRGPFAHLWIAVVLAGIMFGAAVGTLASKNRTGRILYTLAGTLLVPLAVMTWAVLAGVESSHRN